METDQNENLKITFEDYRKISNMVILHMRDYEEKNKGMKLYRCIYHVEVVGRSKKHAH